MNEFNYEGWVGSIIDGFSSSSEFPDVGSENVLYIVRNNGQVQLYVWDNETNDYIEFSDGGGSTDHGIPHGGTSGQVLAKKTNTDYDAEWVDQVEGVPAGGTTGQVLAKSSNTDYAVEWVNQSGGGGTQSDWNENDSADPAYIQNRPFYDDSSDLIDFDLTSTISYDPETGDADLTLSGLDPSCELDNYDFENRILEIVKNGGEGIFVSSDDIASCVCSVTYLGTTYTGSFYEVTGSEYPTYCFGQELYEEHWPLKTVDMSNQHTYPFTVSFVDQNNSGFNRLIIATYSETSAEYGDDSIELSVSSNELHQLNEKYIPSTIARTSDVPVMATSITSGDNGFASGDQVYSAIQTACNTLPVQIITSDTTLADDIEVGKMKPIFINNSGTVNITMPGNSSRQYIVIALNVIVLALVSAGKLPHYETVSGGNSLALSWTSSAEPYMLVFVLRLS